MPRQLGKHMQSCWHQNPSRRPTFASLVVSLTQLKREYCEEGVGTAEAGEEAEAPSGGILLFEPPQPQLIKIESAAMSPVEAQASPRHHHVSPSATASRLPRLKPVTSAEEEGEEEAGAHEDPQAQAREPASPPSGERF